MFPEVGFTSLVRDLKVVDLPAPFTPSKAKHSPACREKERLETATRDSGLKNDLDLIE